MWLDTLHEDFGYFSHEGFQYPVPSRNIELIRTEVNVAGPCCACKRSLGTLTCGGCNAVKYCSRECQKYGSPWAGRHGWEDHKEICNRITKHRKETEDAIQALAEDFGGIDVLLLTPLVIFGLFEYECVAGDEFLGPAKADNKQEAYVLSRMRLTEAYAKCGKEALSCTAFRLAAENMLDLLCLCSNKTDVEEERYVYCGWMVAAGMDQEALNYLCYFQHRQQSTIPLPYLDLSKDEDIEGDSYLKLLKDPNDTLDWSTDEWFHDYMIIALIKYKRLQYLLVQRQKDMAGWNMFLMGTHPRAGMASTIQKLRGNYPAIKKIRDYVMEEEIDFRIDQLNSQIEQVLTAVNEQYPFIIPVLIDVRSSPREASMEDEFSITNPAWAYINYGHTWNMSTSYKRVLQKFLDTGHVLSHSTFLRLESNPVEGRRLESNPVEGFLQVAFDVDPTRWYGLWNSNHGHVLAVISRFIPSHFMTTKNLQPHVDVLTSNHSLLNSRHNNDTDAELSVARLVAGNDHTAANILGNACKMAVRQPDVSSTQDQLLHNATAAPSFNQPFPGRVLQPVALARDVHQASTVIPGLYQRSTTAGQHLYNNELTPGYSRHSTTDPDFYNNEPTPWYSRRSTAGPDFYNNEPTPRSTDYCSLAYQIPSARFKASEPNYSPYLSDGESWSRNSSDRSTYPPERSTLRAERSTNLPERSTLRAERCTNPQERSTLRAERSTYPPERSNRPSSNEKLMTRNEVLDDDDLGLRDLELRLNLRNSQ